MSDRVLANAKIDIGAWVLITEREARWLDALIGYGADNLTAAVKAHLGSSYIGGTEEGGREFAKRVGPRLKELLSRCDETRKIFKDFNNA